VTPGSASSEPPAPPYEDHVVRDGPIRQLLFHRVNRVPLQHHLAWDGTSQVNGFVHLASADPTQQVRLPSNSHFGESARRNSRGAAIKPKQGWTPMPPPLSRACPCSACAGAGPRPRTLSAWQPSSCSPTGAAAGRRPHGVPFSRSLGDHSPRVDSPRRPSAAARGRSRAATSIVHLIALNTCWWQGESVSRRPA